jgi:shikimate 5-dehydrogenase
MSRVPRRQRPASIGLGGAAAAVLLAAALAGTSAGCITAFAPNIRREEHHAAMTSQSTRGACLKCHELESHMAKRMQHMDPATLERHMVEMNKVVRPPLVADWMVKDRRGCVECHAIKGGG